MNPMEYHEFLLKNSMFMEIEQELAIYLESVDRTEEEVHDEELLETWKEQYRKNEDAQENQCLTVPGKCGIITWQFSEVEQSITNIIKQTEEEKMKKKLAIVLAMALTVTGVFVGCGKDEKKNNDSAKNQKEVKFEEKKQETSSLSDLTRISRRWDSQEMMGNTQDSIWNLQRKCERLDLEFVAQPIAWDSKDATLGSGEIDCIWNGFTMNGREDDYTWTDAYLDNKQVFVVRGNSGIKSKADLAGKVVDVQTDSSAEAALNDNTELKDSFALLQTIPDYNTGFMDLESGAVDAVAMDIVVASYQIEKRKADFVILEEEISAEEYGVGFAKGNEAVRDQIQKVLKEMAADGTMAEISTKWFGEDITTIGK